MIGQHPKWKYCAYLSRIDLHCSRSPAQDPEVVEAEKQIFDVHLSVQYLHVWNWWGRRGLGEGGGMGYDPSTTGPTECPIFGFLPIKLYVTLRMSTHCHLKLLFTSIGIYKLHCWLIFRKHKLYSTGTYWNQLIAKVPYMAVNGKSFEFFLFKIVS